MSYSHNVIALLNHAKYTPQKERKANKHKSASPICCGKLYKILTDFTSVRVMCRVLCENFWTYEWLFGCSETGLISPGFEVHLLFIVQNGQAAICENTRDFNDSLADGWTACCL